MFSVILPVYNESKSLPCVLSELLEVCDFENGEIVIVDDSENSLTQQNCESLIKANPIKYIHRGKRLGLASAVIDGFESASGDWLFCMDGDGSHDPAVIVNMLDHISNPENELDIIIGSRYTEGGEVDENWPWMRKLVSRLFCLSVWPLVRVQDPMSGCFAVRKTFYSDYKSRFEGLGYKILLEILVKAQCRRYKEVPLSFRPRGKGKSKVTVKIMLESIYHICKLYKFGVLLRQK